MTECPKCGHEWDDECWGSPMTPEDREQMKKNEPIRYHTMVMAETELLRHCQTTNALIDFLKK